MKFKKIEFKDVNAQRVYNNYIKTVEAAVNPLSKDDRLDILMEFNSHIYENIQRKTQGTEMDCLLNAIDRLGTPEEVLKPLIADKMLEKATRTFNPLHVISALFFNIANGISYIIFAFLYLFLFAFIFLIGAKIFNPNVGMYFKDGHFQALGIAMGDGYYEVLGHWFIPFMIVLTIALYLFITLFLKLKKSLTKSKTMKSVITTIVLLLAFNFANAQNTEHTKLDNFFSILEENDRFHGSVAVSQNGEIIYSKAIGYADIETNASNNTETKFRVGSISKTFTAALIMKAVELNKIGLDATINRYFPTVENADKITIRHLLNHRSGINNFTDKEYLSWYTKPATRANLLDEIMARGNGFEPDTDHSYSNSNYVLLTFILEDVFGKPYPQLLEEYIVNPLGLENTAYGKKINPTLNEANSYQLETEWDIEPETHMSIPLGAGGIISTPTDLCLFIDALFDGKIVSTQYVEQMKPVENEEYGFALYDIDFDDETGLGHGGAIDAFTSTLAYFKEDDLSIAITCNGSNYGKHDIAIAVLNEVFGRPYELPTFEFVELSSNELDQYLGVYECDKLPMDITISKDENQLLLKVTGQTPSVLNAEGDHKFSIMQYGVKVEFIPSEKKMLLEQEGMKFDFEIKQPDENVDLSNETATQASQVVELSSKDLNQYLGVYTSDQLPIDITFTKEGKTLISQATGQSAFPLEAVGNHVFTRKQSGIKVTFYPDKHKVILQQNGMEFELGLKQPINSIKSVDAPNQSLNQYLGVYESDKIPMDLTITSKDNTLIAQGTGQPSFKLEAEAEHTFVKKDLGLKIIFNPKAKKLSFTQGTARFEMTLKQ